MKIIQTFWSKNADIYTTNYGWLAPEYNLMAWALSALQLKKHHSKLILYCDSATAKVFIDDLDLPYDEVNLALDDLSDNFIPLWAYPKIISYSKQSDPFLHVDGDVFVWDSFLANFGSSRLVAQNLEIGSNGIFKTLQNSIAHFPSCFPENVLKKRTLKSYNAGVLGGNDIDFFQEYCFEARSFVSRNIHLMSELEALNFNYLFEQHLFYYLSRQKGIDINVIFNDSFVENRYVGFSDFIEVPRRRQYLHLMGGYKVNKMSCFQMASELRKNHPEQYYRLISIIKKRKMPLYSDSYKGHIDESTDFKRRFFFFRENKFKSDNESNMEEHYKNVNLKLRSKFLNTLYDETLEKLNLRKFTKKHDYQKLKTSFQKRNHLKDLLKFERALDNNLRAFARLRHHDIYFRDIYLGDYSSGLFDDNIEDQQMQRSPFCKVIKSNYEWSFIDDQFISSINPHLLVNLFCSDPSTVYTLVIPESDFHNFYSLYTLDELDFLILHNMSKPILVKDLLIKMERFFDPEDLKNSYKDYIRLITSRLKAIVVRKAVHFNEMIDIFSADYCEGKRDLYYKMPLV